MYGDQHGHIDQFIQFFIKHNDWSTLRYDVHTVEQCVPLVFQSINNRTNRRSVFRNTHYIQAKEWDVETFVRHGWDGTTVTYEHEKDFFFQYSNTVSSRYCQFLPK